MESLHDAINNRQLPNGGEDSNFRKPDAAHVDELADRIVAEFNSLAYRKWYCQAIYDLGTAKIEELLVRARTGKKPALLFTHLVNEFRRYKRKSVPEDL